MAELALVDTPRSGRVNGSVKPTAVMAELNVGMVVAAVSQAGVAVEVIVERPEAEVFPPTIGTPRHHEPAPHQFTRAQHLKRKFCNGI